MGRRRRSRFQRHCAKQVDFLGRRKTETGLSSPPPPGLVHELLTNAIVLGVIAWAGFSNTVIGLAVAIQQIRRVARSARAATQAVERLSALVHSRERLLDLSTALRYLDNGKNHISQRDYSKASIFLELARAECVQAQELLGAEPQKQKLGNVVLRIARLTEALSRDEAEKKGEDTSVQRAKEARAIVGVINAALA